MIRQNWQFSVFLCDKLASAMDAKDDLTEGQQKIKNKLAQKQNEPD